MKNNYQYDITCHIFQNYYNPGHNKLEFYSVLLQIRFATSKTKFDVYHNKLYGLPHKLPNDLLRFSQIWAGAELVPSIPPRIKLW